MTRYQPLYSIYSVLLYTWQIFSTFRLHKKMMIWLDLNYQLYVNRNRQAGHDQEFKIKRCSTLCTEDVECQSKYFRYNLSDWAHHCATWQLMNRGALINWKIIDQSLARPIFPYSWDTKTSFTHQIGPRGNKYRHLQITETKS